MPAGCIFMSFFSTHGPGMRLISISWWHKEEELPGLAAWRCTDKDERTSGLTRSLLLAGCGTRETSSWQRFLKWLEVGRREGLLRFIRPYSFEKAGGSWGEGWVREAARCEEMLSQRKTFKGWIWLSKRRHAEVFPCKAFMCISRLVSPQHCLQ